MDSQHHNETLTSTQKEEEAIRKLIGVGGTGKNTIESTTTEVTDIAKSSPIASGSVASAALSSSTAKFLPVRGRQATLFRPGSPEPSVGSPSLSARARIHFIDVAGPPPPVVPNYPAIKDIASSGAGAGERASSLRQYASTPPPKAFSPPTEATSSTANALPLRRRASSLRSRSRASSRSVISTRRLPSPMAMCPSPLVSDSLSAVIAISQKKTQVRLALGFKDDETFQVWCRRCVDTSFDEFARPYMRDWPNYSHHLTTEEVNEATEIGRYALIALIENDEARYLEGDCEFFPLFLFLSFPVTRI